jgi:hypothetical protein
MIRNDYRHALILLRSSVKGMSGHVRLERRTLNGSMRFSVSGAGTSDNLRALLMRKGKNGWTGVQMGALHVDNRGQAGLTWTFDPRNIEGAALEDYPVVAVVQLKNGQVEPAMSGFVNGSTDLDWAQAMGAVRAMYRRPDAQRVLPVMEPVGGLPEAEEYRGAQQQTEVQYAQPEETQEPTEAQEPTEVQEPAEVQEPTAEDSQKPAAFFLALDISIPWPVSVEPLRALFQQLPVCTPFPADGYTFVCAPLPGNGKAHSLVGVRVEDERPTSVCYGIPGTFALEPPAGLDGYMWRGSGSSGWWVIFVDALTGEEVPE